MGITYAQNGVVGVLLLLYTIQWLSSSPHDLEIFNLMLGWLAKCFYPWIYSSSVSLIS